MSPSAACVALLSAAFPPKPSASASSMASAAFRPFRLEPTLHSASHASAAYAMLLRSITASAPQAAIFAYRLRVGFAFISFKSERQRKKPPNSTSFVAFTAITICSG